MRILIFALLAFFLVGAPCSADRPVLSMEEQAWLRQHPGPLRVHNERGWKPFNYNVDGEPRGYSIDYMNLLAKKLGLKIKYVSGPTWDQFLRMMRDESLDLMVNIASTKDRREYLAFTEPYLITFTALYVRNSESGISDLDDMAGKRLGFTRGFFFGEFVRRYYPEIETVTFDSSLDTFRGVEEGLADAAMEVPAVARRVLFDAGVKGIKRGGKVTDPRFITTFSIATRKDRSLLRDILQKGMDSITSAEASAINKRWNLEDSEFPVIPEDDLAYLQRMGELRLCVNPHRFPLEGMDSSATPTGISSEFVKLLEERMDIPLRPVRTRNWAESLEFAKEKRCDLLPMVIETEERKRFLNFTASWLSLQSVVATRLDQIYIADLGQVSGKAIGVVRGLAIRDMLAAAHPGIKLVEVESVRDGLIRVTDGELFGFVDTIPVISHTIRTEAISGVKISGELGLDMAFSVGVRKDDPKLLAVLDRSVAAIDRQRISGIHNRWLTVAYIDRSDYTRFWLVLLGILLVTLYFYYRFRKGQRVARVLRAAHNELESANRALDRQARTDPLTQISNRLHTDEVLHREIQRFERYEAGFSIVILDIDRFKRVNDIHGHQIGDEVLKHVAGVISRKTRQSDQVGRWGGEEFLAICPATTLEGARKLAETLRSEIANDETEGLPPQTVSCGVASAQPGDSIRELVRRADEALYRAKEEGRNRVAG